MVWLNVPLWVKILNLLFVIIDISFIAIFLCKLYEILSNSKAEQILKGVILFVVIYVVTSVFKLYTCKWILDQIGSVMVVALIVLFQPELREVLTKIGNSQFKKINIKDAQEDLKEIMKAVQLLAIQKVGALIILERTVGLKSQIENGTLIHGKITASLLCTIFKYGTPLHDGAVIIKDDEIVAAACYLPLSDSTQISRDFGTRHRAALGITEEGRDCIAIVVSEETGKISLAYEGKIYTNYDIDMLTEEVSKLMGIEEKQETAVNGN